MFTTTTSIFLLLLTFYLSTTTSTTSHHRHLLHQPFFPLNTFPPTQPPTSSPQPQPHQPTLPKYPFSTTPSTPQKPFFPTFPSPPPPPPSTTALATFPANISSLLFPHQPSSSSRHHVIAIAVSVSLLTAAILAAISALFLYSRTTKRPTPTISTTTDKSSLSDSLRLFPPNTAPSDKPPRYTSANTSSEFLYLGTLVNSRGEIETNNNNNNSNNNTNKTNIANNIGVKLNISSSSSSPYQKLGSPELKPLPPLPRHNYSYTSGEVGINTNDELETEGEEEDEEFFSPRGSSGRKESPKRVGSSSRRDFQGIGSENFGSRSFNSRTASYPYSHSCSPSNSIVSTTPSPVASVSPRSLKPKSPDSFVHFPAPPVAMTRSRSSISSSSSSSVKTQNSLDRISVVSLQNKQSPTGFVAIKLPPPPPPPPPPRFWEIPVGEPNFGPPILVAPSRPVVLQNLGPNLVHEQLQSSEAVERSEETPKPKLKPLHWDKVRASSDRAMVWDQIKSSSFQ